jgi:coenzyme PQQ precursor peptide PqqA
MARRLSARWRAVHDGGRDALSRTAPPGAANPGPERPAMQWQTPQAWDFRFGFEITMYVLAR